MYNIIFFFTILSTFLDFTSLTKTSIKIMTNDMYSNTQNRFKLEKLRHTFQNSMKIWKNN